MEIEGPGCDNSTETRWDYSGICHSCLVFVKSYNM